MEWHLQPCRISGLFPCVHGNRSSDPICCFTCLSINLSDRGRCRMEDIPPGPRVDQSVWDSFAPYRLPQLRWESSEGVKRPFTGASAVGGRHGAS